MVCWKKALHEVVLIWTP